MSLQNTGHAGVAGRKSAGACGGGRVDPVRAAAGVRYGALGPLPGGRVAVQSAYRGVDLAARPPAAPSGP